MDLGFCEILSVLRRDNVAIVDSVGTEGGTIPRHAHDETEILIVYEGAAEIQIEGAESITLLAGDVVRVPPDTAHAFTYGPGCRVLGATIPASKDYPNE